MEQRKQDSSSMLKEHGKGLREGEERGPTVQPFIAQEACLPTLSHLVALKLCKLGAIVISI